MVKTKAHPLSRQLNRKQVLTVLKMYNCMPQFRYALNSLEGNLFAFEFELRLKDMFLAVFEKNEDTDKEITEEFYEFSRKALVYIILFGYVPYGRKFINKRWKPYVPDIGTGAAEYYYTFDAERKWIWKWDPIVLNTMGSQAISRFNIEGDKRIHIWISPMYAPHANGELNSIASSCINDFLVLSRYLDNLLRSQDKQLKDNVMFKKLMPKLDTDDQLKVYIKYKTNLQREEMYMRWQDENNKKLAGFRRMYNATDPDYTSNNYLGLSPEDPDYDYDANAMRELHESMNLSRAYQGDTSIVGNMMGSLVEMHQMEVTPITHLPLSEAQKRLDSIIVKLLGGSDITAGKTLQEAASSDKNARNGFLKKMATDLGAIMTQCFLLTCDEEHRFIAKLMRNVLPDVNFEEVLSRVSIVVHPMSVLSESVTSALIDSCKNMDDAQRMDTLYSVAKLTTGIDIKEAIEYANKKYPRDEQGDERIKSVMGTVLATNPIFTNLEERPFYEKKKKFMSGIFKGKFPDKKRTIEEVDEDEQEEREPTKKKRKLDKNTGMKKRGSHETNMEVEKKRLSK